VRAAIFLDRDGVINRAIVRNGKPYPPASVAELEVLPGVPEALARLKAAGYRLIVVTNQPDVARGTQRREEVDAMHASLASRLPLDEVRVCFHDDADGCECRKPRPGLLTQAPRYDVARSVMVGDRWRDIEAGRRAGVRATVLVASGHDEPCDVEPDLRVGSLAEAVPWILSMERR
jgi:D-glycero-D-manno-heptose 1,7-bisphosphate phosphatase